MNILVTGGAGYIGSHTVIELLNNGHIVTILDNFSNSSPAILDRITLLTGVTPCLVRADVNDKETLDSTFNTSAFDAVMHFAGVKAVGESTINPLLYYSTNVCGSIALLQAMQKYKVTTFIFSSSATVYGSPSQFPIAETCATNPTNPYGRSKLSVEDLLADIYSSDNTWKIAILRYFNPVGAHESGLIGECPAGIPNNLMPYLSQVAAGIRPEVIVYGSDYPTPDGTGIRDYIHVSDLAIGHIAALDHISSSSHGVYLPMNLGTGRGYSVLEIIQAFEIACGRKIPYRYSERRPGDIAQSYADVSRSNELLRWVAKKDITDMCSDVWRWQIRNPQGYAQ